MRQSIALAMLLVSATPSHAQRDLREDFNKMMQCLPMAQRLIGISSAALFAKCGTLYKANTTITAYGKSEQLVFGHASFVGMYVYVENGIVTAVQVPGR